MWAWSRVTNNHYISTVLSLYVRLAHGRLTVIVLIMFILIIFVVLEVLWLKSSSASSLSRLQPHVNNAVHCLSDCSHLHWNFVINTWAQRHSLAPFKPLLKTGKCLWIFNIFAGFYHPTLAISYFYLIWFYPLMFYDPCDCFLQFSVEHFVTSFKFIIIILFDLKANISMLTCTYRRY